MKRLFQILWIAGLLHISGWAADKRPDFGGTWQLDTKLSDAEPTCTRKLPGTARNGALVFKPCDDLGIVSKTLVMNHTRSEITITNGLVEIYKPDNNDEAYRTSLSRRKFTVNTTVSNWASKEIRIRKEFSLSKDGKIMTLKISANNRSHELGIGFETWQKLVYHLK